MEKTYKITGKTNGWIAQRDSMFNGRTEIVIASELSLADAQERLRQMFCNDYEECASSIMEATDTESGNAHLSDYGDGTYSYWYDSRKFAIEEEE